MNDIIPVRSGEELNIEKVHTFLLKSLPEIPRDIPLSIRQFGVGASNLTYELTIGKWEAVLRKPPLGPVAPKAHDMEREYLVLKTLHPMFPIAPKPYIFSDDHSIVGSPFFIMERKHGVLVDTEFPPNIKESKELGKQLSEQMVNTLVQLHELPYKGTVLEELSNPKGFMERQVFGWIKRYERSKTEEIKEADDITNWLVKNIPQSKASTIIHYDFKFNNTLFTSDLDELSGLFDWEMSTVGDPLADVGAALSYWCQADDPYLLKNGLGKPPITVREGFFTRKQFIESYAKKSGRDVSQIHYYLTFAYFKLAVICQQIYFRYHKGQTTDPRFKNFHLYVKTLIQHATAVCQQPNKVR
ncbi:aminoglycoside phosphotransferase (APT) family kinase protein [Metabacillus crassostreae]|uniref:phosphotransferase family protein n=1 Tax=Metabacillus crassostreae TaxID=929098 RepID=UPI001956714F|nr:phosphotransferase family protein [Metabacillus crassostreae]MBM7603599.1 aminoglycoside phosphotransferase (APT) family kinase protein [Metabacillus crassostreae]